VRIQMGLLHIIAGMQIAAATKYSGVRPGLILNINYTHIKFLFSITCQTPDITVRLQLFSGRRLVFNWEKYIPVSTNGTLANASPSLPRVLCLASRSSATVGRKPHRVRRTRA
jgi:hypothetical protein